jgi:hypothetical protein
LITPINYNDTLYLIIPQTRYMNILFLCVANSARSQMAEGFGKSLCLGKDTTSKVLAQFHQEKAES